MRIFLHVEEVQLNQYSDYRFNSNTYTHMFCSQHKLSGFSLYDCVFLCVIWVHLKSLKGSRHVTLEHRHLGK